MSRCFPYPPPGYALSRASSNSLIETLKLQKERKKAREQRKKEKRRRKQEKKEKKGKEKKDGINERLDKSNILKSQNDEKVWADKKDKFLSKGRNPEIEQMEKSTLSEDHTGPVCLEIPSSSSDSTENSHKRKRHSSRLDGTYSHCKIIWVQPPPKKKNAPDALANELRLGFKSGTRVLHVKNKDVDGLRDERKNSLFSLEGGSDICHNFSLIIDEEQDALGYNNLIEYWSPPPQHNACLAPDLSWLFQSRNADTVAEKRWISRNGNMTCSGSSAMWPCAQYLNDVEIYASPFTVPF